MDEWRANERRAGGPSLRADEQKQIDKKRDWDKHWDK